MAPIILGNASSIGNVSNIIVPYKDQYRISTGGVGGVAIGNTVNSSVFSTGTVIIAGTNLTINTSAVGAHQYLNLSIADPAAAANYVQGGDYISLSTGGIGTTISVTGLQPAGAYITTAALSDHNHGGTAFATGNIGGTIGTYTTSSATGSFYGWSLSIPDFLVTAAESNHTHSIYAGIGTSTGTTTGTDAKLTVNTAGISLRTPRYLTTAANISHTHGNPVGYNITIGSSSNNLILSVGNYLTTAALSNHSHSEYLTTAQGGNNLTLAGNTIGTLTEMNSGTVTIAGGNNITLSQNGNAFTIIGAASGTNAGIALSADGSNTAGTLNIISSGTLNLQGGNNITLSQSGNTVHIIGSAGNVGTGFTSSSITGNNIAGTLSTNGLSLLVPQYMLSSASANFAGTGSSIIGGSMTYNTAGLTLNIPTASISASNSIYAGNNISLSTAGVATTVSVVGVLGTEAAGSFMQTAFSTLLQAVSNSTLSIGTNQSSLFQLTAHNSNSLGTTYTSHTHSNLYIALSESSLYRSSVLSNTFLTTGYISHTHSNLYLPVSASTAYQTSVLDNTFALTNHSHSQYLTTAMLSNYTSVFEHTSHTSAITSNAIHSSQTGSVIFANSLNSNVTWTSTYSSNSTYLGASVNTISGTAAGGAALRGSGTYTQNSGTIQFANSNGITFGLTNNQMTASVSNNVGSMYFNDTNGVTFGISSNTNNQSTITASIGNYLTTALATNYTSHTHNYAGINTAMTGGTLSINTNGVSVNVQQRSMYFADGNGITFGSSTNGYSTTITASVNAGTATGGGTSIVPGSYLSSSLNGSTLSLSVTGLQATSATSAITSNAVHTSLLNALQYTSVNSLSLGTSYTSHTHNYAAISHTHNYMGTGISTSGNITVTANTAGLSMTAPTLGYLYFSNTNGHSWSSSTSGVSTSIWIYTS